MRREPMRQGDPASRSFVPLFRSRGFQILFLATVLVALPRPAAAIAAHPSTPAALRADTLETGRFHVLPFRLPIPDLFSTDYLERALQRSGERIDNAAAREYAERYDIRVELARQILTTARAEGIDPDLAFRLVWVESRFNPRARGPQGALGLMQLMPSTARWLDRSVRTEAEILEPATNLRLGFHYLRRLIEKYGDVRLGLLAYNRGTGTVDRVLRQGRDPENGYSRLVLNAGDGAYRGRGVIPESSRP